MVRQICVVSGLIPLLLLACRFERREDFDFSVDQPLRCGIFKSYYFVRDVKEEVYPDLGLVAANAKGLGLTAEQRLDLTERARQCTEICEVQKDELRLMQEQIKQKLAMNEIKGDLRLLAKEVREFETAKQQWLLGHAGRYRQGLQTLSEEQRARWSFAERSLRVLPAAGK